MQVQNTIHIDAPIEREPVFDNGVPVLDPETGEQLTEAVQGPLNAVAPEAVTNATLTKALGQVLRRPTLLPVPGFALKTALGELSGELLGSRRVVPELAQRTGYSFRQPELLGALETELDSGHGR